MPETILRKRDPRKVGYARVSLRGQKLESQIDQLKDASCHKIFTDKFSGATTSRSGWQGLQEYLRPVDTSMSASGYCFIQKKFLRILGAMRTKK